MTPITLLIIVLILSSVFYFVGRKRAFAVAGGKGARGLHSLPTYYGALTALWCAIPALLVFCLWQMFETAIVTNLVIGDLPDQIRMLPPERLGLVINDIRNLVSGNIVSGEIDPVMQMAADRYRNVQAISMAALTVIALALAVLAALFVRQKINPGMRARNHVETVVKIILILCSTIAVFTTVGIVLSVLYESIRFFKIIPLTDFLFGLEWSPQMAIRADQVGSSGAFGAIPVFLGTAMISVIALTVAVPIGLMSAIYLSEYAGKKFRDAAKPLMEILAGIPTVVYGFFAALTVAPFIRNSGGMLGMDISSESALAAGLVMGIMIIPFVSSLSDDVINAVPQALRDGAYGLGATRSETIRHVVIPAALPGIVGGILLAASRAIGETMIVVMAAGLSANLTANPLETVTTVTVQIVTLLVGDQEFDSPKTLAAFALGLVLFVITLCLNVIALHVVRKYREQYE
ncbi:MAG: phosphate ABC transporter permease subunit PstC [Desulfobacterales bacterium]|nr:phosphate ABC transporter permease subunit PstC [Desulfobacterales bacterium]